MADILIVEDDYAISELIKRNLQKLGHCCWQIYDGKEFLNSYTESRYDLILLDVMLPGISGFELIREIGTTPVIFVTAKGMLEDRLKGLSLGAEDYIVKPFEILELVARVGVVLKRYKKDENLVEIGDVAVDRSRKTVTRRGQEIALTPKEFRLLEVLVQNNNLALSREQLLNRVWGYDYDGEMKTVDVHIQRLRKKLGFEEVIKTVTKVGYRLEIPKTVSGEPE